MAESEKGVPIRKRQKELTRASILEALAEIIVEEGPLGFAVQNVADRAGVSHRTVYRYFPNRKSMCEGIIDHFERLRDEQGERATPQSLKDLLGILPITFSSFGNNRALVRSLALLSLSTGAMPDRVRDRDRLVTRFVRELAPSISRTDQDRSIALIRHLGSSISWMILNTRFDRSDSEAADIVVHGIDLAIRDLKRQERKARKEKDEQK